MTDINIGYLFDINNTDVNNADQEGNDVKPKEILGRDNLDNFIASIFDTDIPLNDDWLILQ